MKGTRRLGLVTALTLTGLLVGATVMSAAANGPPDGRGNPHHDQSAGPQDDGHPGRGLGLLRHAEDELEVALVTGPGRVTDGVRPGWGCGDENHLHSGPPGNPDLDHPPGNPDCEREVTD